MLRLPLALLVVAVLPMPATAQELTFSVAISMKEAVEELGRSFRESRPTLLIAARNGSLP
jgi:hypothetical protein